MPKSFITAFFILLGIFLGAEFATPLSAQEIPEISKHAKSIDTALARLRHVEGRFEQWSAQGGIVKGDFLLSRPGRIRFDYDPPNEHIVIIRDDYIYVRDEPDQAPNRYPKSATPVGLFLDQRIDLAQSRYAQSIEEENELVILHLADPDGDLPGRVSLYFARQNYLLLGWRVTDAQNQTIQIRLSDMYLHRQMDAANFLFPEEDLGE